MKSLHLATCALGLAVGVSAQAPIVTTVLNNGTTQSRYDIVILGDGYQASEQTTFDTHVTTFLTGLFQKQPYATFAAYYNVHTVFRASNQSGADEPDIVPAVYVDTAYDATFNVGGTARCLYIGDTALALADAALAPATEGRVLVMVNTNRYGGCASTFAVSYTGASMIEVQVHEMGHSLGLLADEYDYPNDTYTGAEPGQVNATISPVGQKWSHWWGTDSISAFEGARYYLHGLYRPKSNCLMRSLGVALCAVCREQISKVTNSIVDTIVTTTPATSPVTVASNGSQVFSITHIVPPANNPLITWRLDGTAIPGATGTSYSLAGNSVSLGAHTLAVEVLDQTAFVRNDPAATMRETHSWQVSVQNPVGAQLRLPAFTSSLVWVQPGAAVTASPTVVNDGPADAGAFDVEFFLTSTTSLPTTPDIYLGKLQVGGLLAGQSTVLSTQVQMPWRIRPQLYYLHALVDRTNQVVENNEADNDRYVPLIGQAGPCVTKLEYADPLLYPADSASVSVSLGGVLHPTVVAPCADPQTTLYLIAWGGSGTAPGLQLNPSVLLPLNYDGFTDLGIAALNGPILGGFLGVFDAQGLGHATFTLPSTTGLASAQTHFACVLIGGNDFFAAATNAVELNLLP